jgi:hypothetical protein
MGDPIKMLPILICVTLLKVAKVTVLSVFMKKMETYMNICKVFFTNMFTTVSVITALATLGEIKMLPI